MSFDFMGCVNSLNKNMKRSETVQEINLNDFSLVDLGLPPSKNFKPNGRTRTPLPSMPDEVRNSRSASADDTDVFDVQRHYPQEAIVDKSQHRVPFAKMAENHAKNEDNHSKNDTSNGQIIQTTSIPITI
mmetsp:Transcript_32168/g.42421  ORF Transcript_32168/g.42421 Transcript_32168/m.42421 type:complete len:130 (-) Transcript_32168:120-509(-)